MFTRFQPQNIELRAITINIVSCIKLDKKSNYLYEAVDAYGCLYKAYKAVDASAYAFCKYVGAKMIKEFENV